MAKDKKEQGEHYPLMTDEEFSSLFGKEIAGAARTLDQYANQVCQTCGGECCHRIGCEFYSPKFKTCPIQEYRPAKCRLYYCSKVAHEGDASETVRKLIEVIKDRFAHALFFDAPAIILIHDWIRELGIEEEVHRTIQAFENESMDCAETQSRLKNLIRGERR